MCIRWESKSPSSRCPSSVHSDLSSIHVQMSMESQSQFVFKSNVVPASKFVHYSTDYERKINFCLGGHSSGIDRAAFI